ncbi:MAG: VWA domain-containing protein [Phycisphaerales bacterium]
MSVWFASPGLAVAAAAAVALPVLVHLLLRRRRQPVEWAAMELLRQALRRVERRRRMERWLLLAVRCLLVACAGLAIARPLVGAAQQGATVPRTLVVVLDDSVASSEVLADGRTALQWAAGVARQQVEQLGQADRVAVILAGRPAAGPDEPPTLDRRGPLRALTEAEPSQLPADIPGALQRAARILEEEVVRGTEARVLLASAFRSGTVREQPPLPQLGGASMPVQLWWSAPPPAVGQNAQLVLVEPQRTPGAQDQRLVHVTVRRDRGDGELATTLRIVGPSLVAPVERSVRLAASERERSLDLAVQERPADAAAALRRAVTASLSTDAQPQDDVRASVLAGGERLRVAVVDRRSFQSSTGIDQLPAGEWVARALAPAEDAPVECVALDPAALDARALAAVDALVVAQPGLLDAAQWRLAAEFVARGGTLVLLPSQAERAQGWTPRLREHLQVPWTVALEAEDVEPAAALPSEQPGNGLLRGIAAELAALAPSVQVSRLLPVQVGADAGAVQLAAADGRPLLLAWRPPDARGTVVLFTVAMDLAWSTLPVKPAMVPVWQEVVSEAARQAAAARAVLVGTLPWVDRPGVVELRMVGADGAPVPGARMVPVGAGGRATRAVDRAGLYEMLDSGGRVLGVLAAVINPAAASVEPVDPARVQQWLGAAWRPLQAEDGSAGSGAGDGVGGSAGGTAGNSAGAPAESAAAAGRSTAGTMECALWMLLAACVLGVLESVLARRFSHLPVRAEAAP